MIICTDFKYINKGALVGFVKIDIAKWGVEMSNLTVFEKDGKRWVNLPGQEYIDKEGKKKYNPHIRFKSKEQSDAFQIQIKEAIDKYLAEKGVMPQTTSVGYNSTPTPIDELPF